MPAHGDHHQSPIRNGVDTAQVYGTLDALTDQPKLARFEFRATNHWIDGTRLTGATFGAWWLRDRSPSQAATRAP